jgi:SET domain-containing protein
MSTIVTNHMARTGIEVLSSYALSYQKSTCPHPLHTGDFVVLYSSKPPCKGSMILVRTTVKASPIHDLGLFAEEFIPHGTVILKYEPRFDRAFTEKEIEDLPAMVQNYLLHYSYFSEELGKRVLPFDNDRFVNHAENPNTKVDKSIRTHGEPGVVAIRDIQPGEEITLNYLDMEGDHVKERTDMRGAVIPRLVQTSKPR